MQSWKFKKAKKLWQGPGCLRATRGKSAFFRFFKFSTLQWKIFDSTTKKQYTFKHKCMHPFFPTLILCHNMVLLFKWTHYFVFMIHREYTSIHLTLNFHKRCKYIFLSTTYRAIKISQTGLIFVKSGYDPVWCIIAWKIRDPVRSGPVNRIFGSDPVRSGPVSKNPIRSAPSVDCGTVWNSVEHDNGPRTNPHLF